MAETQPFDADAMALRITALESKVQDMGVAMGLSPGHETGDLVASYRTSKSGFLLANGTIYNVSDFPDLGALCVAAGLSTDGGITFATPDYRGRSISGAGTGSGLTTRALGAAWGAETHLLTGPESGIANHNHTVAATTGSTTPAGGTTGSTTPGAGGSTTPGSVTSGATAPDTNSDRGINPSVGSGGAGGYCWGDAHGATPMTVVSHTHSVPGSAHTHTGAAHTHTYAGVAHTHTLPDTDAHVDTNATTAHDNTSPTRAANIFIKT